jgi:hypothetical protein
MTRLLLPLAWWGRTRVSVSFFAPASGQLHPDEAPAELAGRLLDELRTEVPPVRAGRR